MKIATAACPLSCLTSRPHYEDKLHRWGNDAPAHAADMLLCPDYAAMELQWADARQSTLAQRPTGFTSLQALA